MTDLDGYSDAGYWKQRAESAEDQLIEYRAFVKQASEALQFLRILREMVKPEVSSG